MVPDEVNSFFNKILKDVIVYRQDNDIQRNDLVQYLIDVKRKTLEVEKGNLKSDLVTKSKKFIQLGLKKLSPEKKKLFKFQHTLTTTFSQVASSFSSKDMKHRL